MKNQKLLNEPERVKVIGVPISVINLEIAIEFIERNFDDIRGNYICVSNAHTCVMAHENEDYMKVQSESIMSLPDGKPLSVIGKKKTKNNMSRVTGYDFINKILYDNRFKGKRHYFYGTTQEVLDTMIKKLKDMYNIEVCGYEPSVFRELTEDEIDELADRVNKSKADFLWVAIGAPRQEILMNRLKGKVNCIMIAVGGVFNILAGKVKNAPKWMQELGLEWFYRFCKEPRRLFKRYLITNSKFIYYNWRDK